MVIDRNRGGQGFIYYRSALDGYILSIARGKFVHPYRWRRKNPAVLDMTLQKFSISSKMVKIGACSILSLHNKLEMAGRSPLTSPWKKGKAALDRTNMGILFCRNQGGCTFKIRIDMTMTDAL